MTYATETATWQNLMSGAQTITSAGGGSISLSGTPATGFTGTSTSGPTPLTTDQQNAYSIMQGILTNVGLGSLASTVLSIIQQGYTDSNAIEVQLQSTPEWKQRFAGNEILKQKGLPELSVSDYLNTENAYAQALKQFGIPNGMYGRSDFANWIGNSVSPTEIMGRAQVASQWVNDNDPYFLQALQQFHGITHGDMVAYALDQNRTLPFLQLASQQAQIGAAALRHGLTANADFASTLANAGVTQTQAEQGYGQIAATLPRIEDLAKLSGTSFNQPEAEQATFFGGEAARHQLNIIQQEQARFAGTPGLGNNFYHPAYGLSRDLEGSY